MITIHKCKKVIHLIQQLFSQALILIHISEVKRIKLKPCILDVEAQRTFLFQPGLSSKAIE